ncbi:MAG: hypothetical protein FWD01_01415 [Defluviitaleaceae bacterium]|nr:hypothetical protein [Defluviitaleaceae bacterium]
MEIYSGKNIRNDIPCAITIGKFDGLHLGHRALIDFMQKSTNLPKALLTFSPHPASILAGENIKAILSPHEKIQILEKLGIDIYIEYPFTKKFAELSPEEFLIDIIINQLSGQLLIVGENYKFGKNRLGNIQLAKKICAEYGAEVITFQHLQKDGQKISSNKIRKMIEINRIHLANALLGEPYFIMGKAERFGNVFVLRLPKDKLLPLGTEKYNVKIYAENKTFYAKADIKANSTIFVSDFVDGFNFPFSALDIKTPCCFKLVFY